MKANQHGIQYCQLLPTGLTKCDFLAKYFKMTPLTPTICLLLEHAHSFFNTLSDMISDGGDWRCSTAEDDLNRICFLVDRESHVSHSPSQLFQNKYYINSNIAQE